jgi:hypothetical protein
MCQSEDSPLACKKFAAKKTSIMQMDQGCVITSHLTNCSNSKAKNVLAKRK